MCRYEAVCVAYERALSLRSRVPSSVFRAQLRKAPHAIKRLNVNSAMALYCVPIDIFICEQINRILRKYQSRHMYLFSHQRISVCVQCHTRRSSSMFRINYLSSLPVFNILCRVIINIIPKCVCMCVRYWHSIYGLRRLRRRNRGEHVGMY